MKDANEISEILKKGQQCKDFIEGFLHDQVEQSLKNTHVQLKIRVKTRRSLEKKLEKKKKEKSEYSLSKITDIVGIRFICHFQRDVEQIVEFVLGLIKKTGHYGFSDLLEDARFYTTKSHNQAALRLAIEKIFSKYGAALEPEEKRSRYTSLHIVCGVRNFPDVPVEIQIRNVFEDAWAEIEHALQYKNSINDGRISAAAERHLLVLNTMVQACIEQVEAISIDATDQPLISSRVTSALAKNEDIQYLPEIVRALFAQIIALSDEEAPRALAMIERFCVENSAAIEADKEVQYILAMEQALCFLNMGKLSRAVEKYQDVQQATPEKAMVYYRLADAWRLLGEIPKASEFIDLAYKKLSAGSSTAGERKWLEERIHLKKAYLQWKQRDFAGALNTLKVDYERIKKTNNTLLIQKYVNSMTYYQIELMGEQPQPLELEALKKSKQVFEEWKMTSISQGTLAEMVDTYAWLCYLLWASSGDIDALNSAYRAAEELDAAILYPNGPNEPYLAAQGVKYRISQTDVTGLHYHVSIIRKAWQARSRAKKSNSKQKV